MYDFSIIRQLRTNAGLHIKHISERTGVSPAVISKVERNVSQPDLDTLDRISRAFGMNPSEILALAESRTARHEHETGHHVDGFTFREIGHGNVRLLLGKSQGHARLSRPHVHGDDYEICWVLKGSLLFSLPQEQHELHAGDSIQFDAVLEHVYEANQAVSFLLTHIPKYMTPNASNETKRN